MTGWSLVTSLKIALEVPPARSPASDSTRAYRRHFRHGPRRPAADTPRRQRAWQCSWACYQLGLELHAPVFEGGRRVGASENLRELRAYCQRQLGEVREDVLRPLNPTPYKTSVSAELFSFLQDALQRHQPITELT